jgi:ABC transporter substrate binding protein
VRLNGKDHIFDSFRMCDPGPRAEMPALRNARCGSWSREVASYVDRILRGDKPGDLPVRAPTKFGTTVNLRTAKALNITIPPGLLVAADEVIE